MEQKSKQEIIEIIEKIFQEQFLDDNLTISEKTTPEHIDEWDSLAHINLLVAIEKEFNIRFSAEDMGEINSVASLLEKLLQRNPQ
jgi:acyl carrier protein